jgi:hypothetical protein
MFFKFHMHASRPNMVGVVAQVRNVLKKYEAKLEI